MMIDWPQDKVKVGGVTIHYAHTGNGSKPALVLAHGFTDSGMCWLPVAQALSADYDVYLPDAVGHGLSSRVQPGQEIDLPGDLAGFIQALKLNHPIVGGHSMGGSTTAGMAARYPNLARALILEDPAFIDEPKHEVKQPDEPNPWHEWLRGLPSQTVEQVMAHGRSENPTWPEVEMRPWAESKKQFDVNFVNARQKNELTSWREAVKAIRVPTLLITAEPERGSIVTPETAEYIQDLNPHFHVVQIHNSGHSIRRENFADYMDAVRGFLAEL